MAGAQSSKRGVRTASTPVSPEAIEREAIRLFAEKTYPVIGMRDLSEAVGILPGSLYAHISSKEALLLTIVEKGIRNYIDAIDAVVATDEPADVRFRAALRAHMRVMEDTADQTRVAFHQWHYLGPVNRDRILDLRRAYLAIFVGIAEDGIAEGTFRPVPHLRATLLAMIGGLSTATEWYATNKADTPDQMADALTDAFLYGLATDRTKAPARKK